MGRRARNETALIVRAIPTVIVNSSSENPFCLPFRIDFIYSIGFHAHYFLQSFNPEKPRAISKHTLGESLGSILGIGALSVKALRCHDEGLVFCNWAGDYSHVIEFSRVNRRLEFRSPEENDSGNLSDELG